MSLVQSNTNDSEARKRTGKATPSHTQAISEYQHKDKDELDRTRYELYQQQKNTPEYKAMRKIHNII